MNELNPTSVELFNRYCIIKPLDSKEEYEYLTVQSDRERKTQEGEVIAVAETNINERGIEMPIRFKVGDTVIFSRFGGEEFEYKMNKYKIIEISQVFGLFHNPSLNEENNAGQESEQHSHAQEPAAAEPTPAANEGVNEPAQTENAPDQVQA